MASDPVRSARATHGAASAPMAAAFGAKIDVGAPGSTLALVLGRAGQPPHGAVAAAGGRVLADLGGGRVVALVELRALLGLRQHPAVTTAGPISVDPERFARFAALVDLDNPQNQ